MENEIVSDEQFESPYHEAWDFIKKFDCGASSHLAKLILSLYNGYEYPFAVSECLEGLDSERTRLALTIISHYSEHGETQALRDIGVAVLKHYPYLAALGQAIRKARTKLEKAR